MINLNVEDYCHGCRDFEPDTYYNYPEINDISIFCKHLNKCAQLKKYIERQSEVRDDRKERPIKSDALCDTCYYGVVNDGCLECDGCDMTMKPESPVGRDGFSMCYCRSIRDGEPCKYYKKGTKNDIQN